MAKKYKLLILTGIILSYALMHVATTKERKCETDCEAVYNVEKAMKQGRDYVYNVTRCAGYQDRDTLCVLVDLNTGAGTNWNTLAESTCTYATQYGILNQYVLVIGSSGTFADTVARKQCP